MFDFGPLNLGLDDFFFNLKNIGARSGRMFHIFFPKQFTFWVLNAFLVCLPCLECCVPPLLGLSSQLVWELVWDMCDFICNFHGGVIWGLGPCLGDGVSKYF